MAKKRGAGGSRKKAFYQVWGVVVRCSTGRPLGEKRYKKCARKVKRTPGKEKKKKVGERPRQPAIQEWSFCDVMEHKQGKGQAWKG